MIPRHRRTAARQHGSGGASALRCATHDSAPRPDGRAPTRFKWLYDGRPGASGEGLHDDPRVPTRRCERARGRGEELRPGRDGFRAGAALGIGTRSVRRVRAPRHRSQEASAGRRGGRRHCRRLRRLRAAAEGKRRRPRVSDRRTRFARPRRRRRAAARRARARLRATRRETRLGGDRRAQPRRLFAAHRARLSRRAPTLSDATRRHAGRRAHADRGTRTRPREARGRGCDARDLHGLRLRDAHARGDACGAGRRSPRALGGASRRQGRRLRRTRDALARATMGGVRRASTRRCRITESARRWWRGLSRVNSKRARRAPCCCYHREIGRRCRRTRRSGSTDTDWWTFWRRASS